MDNKTKPEIKPINQERLFEIICQNKNTHASNLNEVFESYGCDLLEAKVPLAARSTVDKMAEVSQEQRQYTTLQLKAKAATATIDGRHGRTRNRDLKVVEIDGEIVISVGEKREESPVDPDLLDEELDEYMKERARLKASMNQEGQDSVFERDVDMGTPDLDEDLEAYMKEASRIKAQKKRLIEQMDRMNVMESLEEDVDYDH